MSRNAKYSIVYTANYFHLALDYECCQYPMFFYAHILFLQVDITHQQILKQRTYRSLVWSRLDIFSIFSIGKRYPDINSGIHYLATSDSLEGTVWIKCSRSTNANLLYYFSFFSRSIVIITIILKLKILKSLRNL